MANLKLPNVVISFLSTAATAIERGNRGIICVLLVDANYTGTVITKIATPEAVADFDDDFAAANQLSDDEKAYLSRGWLGGINPIKYMMLIQATSLSNAISAAKTIKFDYLVGAPDLTSGDATTIATAVKSMRSNGQKVKAVLPNTAADDEGIINFVTGGIVVGEDTFSATQYCSRIAGLLAGTPLQQSATFYRLSEVDDITTKLTKDELDALISAGKFAIYHDGEKVKVARAVNSLTTIGSGKSDDWKSIKIIDIMDLIYMDVKKTCEDSYIGRYPNNYLNKCNLRDAIDAYLRALRTDQLIDEDIKVDIDLDAQANYLRGIGVDVDNMSDQQIKEANTSSYVWLQASYKILNAIEDITVKFYI